MIVNTKFRGLLGDTHWRMYRTAPGGGTIAYSVTYGPMEAIHSPHAVAARIWRARREMRAVIARCPNG